MNEHQQIEPLLAVYRDLDELTRQRVDAHTARCTACASQLEAFREVERAFNVLYETDLARFSRSNVDKESFYAAIEAERRSPTWLKRVFVSLAAPATALLTGVLLLATLLLFGVWLASLSGTSSTGPIHVTRPLEKEADDAY